MVPGPFHVCVRRAVQPYGPRADSRIGDAALTGFGGAKHDGEPRLCRLHPRPLRSARVREPSIGRPASPVRHLCRNDSAAHCLRQYLPDRRRHPGGPGGVLCFRRCRGSTSRRGPGRAAPGPYAPRLVPREIPALGPRTRGGIPADARQALVVTGDSYDSSLSTAVLYTRDDPAAGWRAATGRWPAHNGLNGWTDEHWEGDLRTPVGVYGLTAAGGRFEPRRPRSRTSSARSSR